MNKNLMPILLLLIWGTVSADELQQGRQIAQWIKNLKSPLFRVREEAMDRLIVAGFPAVEPLAKAVRDKNIELHSRGIQLLKQLALSDDPQTAEAAQKALEREAAAEGIQTNHRASISLRYVYQVRREIALREIKNLGGRISIYSPLQTPIIIGGGQATFSIRLGPMLNGGTKALEQLKWLPDLQQLTFIGPQVTDDWLEYIKPLKDLKFLQLQKTSITDHGLSILPSLDKLQQLSIESSQITDSGMQSIGSLTQLVSLSIDGTQISSAGLEVLKNLNQLVFLSLSSPEFDNSALDRLQVLTNLRVLSIYGPLVTDEGMQSLEKLTNLQNLVIKRANLTRAGFRSIQKLPFLESLSLRYIPITDHDVLQIAESRSIKKVELYGTKVTYQGAKELQDLLNNSMGQARSIRQVLAIVDYRQGGFLGVGGQVHESGCEITVLRPGSAAANSDVRIGDVILKYDGKQVESFKILTQLISKNTAGDTISLEILRDGKEKLQKKIILGEW